MSRATIYPKADRSQWFAGAYPGDIMPHPNVVVLHTTEGSSWPGYSGGALAPTFTYDATSGVIRQHFPVNMSARALVHPPGVPTNTLNVVQIEIIGTCAKGGPGIYWPAATDAQLAGLVDLLRWLNTEWSIPLVSTTKPWTSYPASYGLQAPQRMSANEWLNFTGVCGHQHVYGNEHGDPGDFPAQRLLALVTPPPAPPEPPLALSDTDVQRIAQAVWDYQLTLSADQVAQGHYSQDSFPASSFQKGADLRLRLLQAALSAIVSTTPPVQVKK